MAASSHNRAVSRLRVAGARSGKPAARGGGVLFCGEALTGSGEERPQRDRTAPKGISQGLELGEDLLERLLEYVG
jgi:hypothetical protein